MRVSPPPGCEKARDLIARLAAARLLAGWRGAAALDTEAVVDALCALGDLATDLADVMQSVDVNPFVALPRGGLALDALVVLQRKEAGS